MELKREDIQVLRTKSRATSQVTFDVDYNVPDVKPDIGRMIQNKGNVSVEEVRLNDGHAFLKGNLQVDLLYVGEEEGRVNSLSAKLPMEETMNLEGIVSGDKLCLQWEIEDLSIHLNNAIYLNPVFYDLCLIYFYFSLAVTDLKNFSLHFFDLNPVRYSAF